MKNSMSDQFSMKLDYQDGIAQGFNGNITKQFWDWSNSLNPVANTFNYGYDPLNRLVTAAKTTGTSMSESITYDVMGNIKSLNRDNSGQKNYTYLNVNASNRLQSVSGLTVSDYEYDANGNATIDGNKGIQLTYNYLNLPKTAIKGTAVNLAYTYDAEGNKLSKNDNGTIRNYIGGIEYNLDATIDLIHTEEGVAQNNGGTYSYHYNLSDHLGNVRYTFDIYNGAVRMLQRDDYYAFGLRKSIPNNSGAVSLNNKYLYNGKELLDGLEQYDYGARFYDPVAGRWNSVDPLADQYRRWSPYNYVVDNPVRFIDPDGMGVTEGVGWISYTGADAQAAISQYKSQISPVSDDDDDDDDWLKKLLSLLGIGSKNTPRSRQDAQNISENWRPINQLANRAEESEEKLSDIPVIGGLYQVMKYGTGTFSNRPNYLGVAAGLTSVGFDLLNGYEIAGAYKSLSKLGLKDGVKRSANEVLELAQKFLGKGYKEPVPGSGRFVSADGKRVFRMGESDITGAHGGGPHVNFETLVPNPSKPGKMMVKDNYHIYLKD